MTRHTNYLIKLTASLMLASILHLPVIAQKESFVKKFYASAGIGGVTTNGEATTLALQMMMKKNWTASITFQNMNVEPKNLPEDYTPGYMLFLMLPLVDRLPDNEINSLNITVGKYHELGRRTWVTAEGGIALVSGQEYKFTPQAVQEQFFGFGWSANSNYSATKENKFSMGGVIKTEFHWAFLPWVGLGAGLYANVNGIQSYAGGHFSLTAGWMNLKKKQKRQKGV